MKKAADVPKLPTRPLTALRAAQVVLRRCRANNPESRWPKGLEDALAKVRSAIQVLEGPAEDPLPPGTVELFPPDVFLEKPITPVPELADCLTNPLEYDGPPAGRAALIERLISMTTTTKTRP